MSERRFQRRFVMLTALTGLTCVLLVEFGVNLSRSGDAESPVPTVRITLQRTACYGTCPVYSVELRDDGTVIFRGERFVQSIGEHVTRIDPEQVRQLVEEFYRANFLALEDAYDSDVTDSPTTILSLAIGNEEKRVVDHISGPPELKLLQDRVDAVAQTSQWIGSGDERLKVR